MVTRVIVDADQYAYSCGGATQRTVYSWLAVVGDEIVASGESETDNVTAQDLGLPAEARLEIAETIEAAPLSFALNLCRRSLWAIEEAMDEAGVEFNKLELVLTGKGNFRDGIATIRGYKANRIGIPKPKHYKGIRRYMVQRWDALVVTGWEADDYLAMAAHKAWYDPEQVVLVSQDKDLCTVPGRLYNPRRREWRTITENDALVAFYRQVITGDTTDNIVGCYKSGPKAAEKIILPGMTGLEMYDAARLEYARSIARNGCPYADPDAALLENARLVHLARTPAQTEPSHWWTPPTGETT